MRKTSKKSIRKGLRKFHEWLKENRHMKVALQHEKLHQKLVGYYGYYKIIGNSRSLNVFKDKVQKLWRYWLNRRNRIIHFLVRRSAREQSFLTPVSSLSSLHLVTIVLLSAIIIVYINAINITYF